MARIRIPPPLLSLTDRQAERVLSLLDKYGVTDRKGRYLHWHDFKWRVESGDLEEEAWLATKLARRAIAQVIPLLKAEGDRYFSYCVPNSIAALLHSIDRITGGSDAIGGKAVGSSRPNHRYLVKSLMMEEAITSAQLEGASTTRKVAKQMLERNLPPHNKSEQMILNNFLLMQAVIKRKDEELSVPMLLELHQIATDNAIENQAISGVLRIDNSIIISDAYNQNTFIPPRAETIEARLKDLCIFANDAHDGQGSNHFIHPMIKAIILHFMIGYIHPFGDGNGRTARAVFYWSILKSGYWLFEYISISKWIQAKRSDYDTAFIYTETDDFDLTYFIYNQVETIAKAAADLLDHIDQKQKEFYEFLAWIDRSAIAKKLNKSHLEILKSAVKEPGREFTSKQVSLDLGVTENSARSYLNKLVDLELLISAKSKNGKTIRYLAPASLRDKLGN
jgi:Fic family protein